MAFRAVCFDLDGTLLDTLADLADAMNRALAKCDLPVHPVDAYRTFVGNGLATLVHRAAPAAESDADLADTLIAGMRAEYSKRWAERTKPYDGIPQMLDALAARGLPMAILSNKPHDFTQLCVAELLPHWAFTCVQGVSDDVPPKPDPAGAAKVASILGADPAEILYVGDSDTDMKTANAAGMFAVGVLWGFRDADELNANGAQKLIAAPAELLGLLDQA
ncbi:MAG: HAD family hydrolase [Planctomycetota bacterium]|jgi:phosphoglycolate phosphatase